MSGKEVTRRRFVGKSARVGAAGIAAFAAISTHAVAASNRIRVGVIGTGQRGRNRIEAAQKAGAQIVALCDINQAQLDTSEAIVQGEKPTRFVAHEDLLALSDIDAVIIASPDHWHHDQLLDAVAAGKDVYLEKPMARTIEEGRHLVEIVEKSDRIVQIGNQRRSGKHWEKARDMVASGKIGPLRFIRTWDTRYRPKDPYVARAKNYDEKKIDWMRFLGKAPSRPFDAVRCSAWRWFWDYAGGLMTDIGPHRLDVAHWISDTLGPRTVVCNGGNYHSPEWQTPDNVHAILDCGTFVINFNVQFMNGHDSGGAGYYGTGGTIIHRQQTGVMQHVDTKGNVVEEWKTPGEGQVHMDNFLECVRSRKQPNSPVGVAHKVLAGAHLANMSFRSGKRIAWDAHHEKIL